MDEFAATVSCFIAAYQPLIDPTVCILFCKNTCPSCFDFHISVSAALSHSTASYCRMTDQCVHL